MVSTSLLPKQNSFGRKANSFSYSNAASKNKNSFQLTTLADEVLEVNLSSGNTLPTFSTSFIEGDTHSLVRPKNSLPMMTDLFKERERNLSPHSLRAAFLAAPSLKYYNR